MALAAAELHQDQLPIDLERLSSQPLVQDPFEHVIVPGFVPPAALAAINRDFPPLAGGGSHTPWTLKSGPAFRTLLRALKSPAFAQVVGEKFGLQLEDKPMLVTVRGHSRAKDGQIHRDSDTKLITVLLYLNDAWDAEGGRLRLLRQPHDLDDYVVEVPPQAGTLLVFRCSETAWHGHKPFVGQRRSLQFNWMTGQGVAWREFLRHSFSDLTRGLQRLFRINR